MARALLHRGPDEEGFLVRPGLGLAARRLSIVGLADGQQPIFNEDRRVSVVFNGELFDYVERREELRRADTSSSRTATLRSSPIYGKIMARKCGSDCEGSSPSHYGRATTPTPTRTRSFRHRAAFLDAAKRLASFRIRN